MMFAHTVHIEPDLIGEFDLFDKVAEPLSRYLRVTDTTWVGFAERINAEFHDGMYFTGGGGCDADHVRSRNPAVPDGK